MRASAARSFPATRCISTSSASSNRGNVWKFDGQALVEGKLVAEATFAAMIMDN